MIAFIDPGRFVVFRYERGDRYLRLTNRNRETWLERRSCAGFIRGQIGYARQQTQLHVLGLQAQHKHRPASCKWEPCRRLCSPVSAA